jgi:dipeptidyl aminopeptidase/acylaminoacyl peptidase
VVVYFRNTAQDANYGKLARVAVASDAVPEMFGGLDCEVVHVSAGSGVCLSADRGVVTTYAAKIFDIGTSEIRMTLPLAGLPSRTRVSKDGQLAATTVFVTGHGYDSVDFSTETLLIDLREQRVLGNVQDFAVTRDGQPFAAEDFNFWGVTFVGDGRHFYATLSTAGEHYLVRADAAAKTATVLRPGVECPSLSPDGKRIAFKRRRPAGANVEWQIMVLDLASGEERVLSEQRTVDDQLEWLDARTVLYALPSNERRGAAVTDVWSVRIDGGQAPRKLLTNAYSPAIDRR